MNNHGRLRTVLVMSDVQAYHVKMKI